VSSAAVRGELWRDICGCKRCTASLADGLPVALRVPTSSIDVRMVSFVLYLRAPSCSKVTIRQMKSFGHQMLSSHQDRSCKEYHVKRPIFAMSHMQIVTVRRLSHRAVSFRPPNPIPIPQIPSPTAPVDHILGSRSHYTRRAKGSQLV
jgi:hypothetical protein